MRELSCTVTDPAGFHARPVTALATEALRWESAVTVSCRGRSAAGRDLMRLMALSAACGDELTVRVEGPDEEEAAIALQTLLEQL